MVEKDEFPVCVCSNQTSPTIFYNALNMNEEKKYCDDCQKDTETEVYNGNTVPNVLICKECWQFTQQ